MTLVAYTAEQIFNGNALLSEHCLLVEDGHILGLETVSKLPNIVEIIDLGAGVISQGFTDLQVNGGGGVMFNDDPSVATLSTMARAHGLLGSTSILPTLITDTPQVTRAAIDAVDQAIAQGIDGIAGLHLEGPHLDPRRAGAHLPKFIRPMEQDDLALLLEAAKRLPVLKVTIAPSAVTLDQISDLAQAGVIVSLGHSECTAQEALAARDAGASCVTHLFNAMSQLTPREPGLVGAALTQTGLMTGLIADLIHIHPDSLRAALSAKPRGSSFLVSDAMAVAGSDLDCFTLNGRKITRRDGRLTLGDGTLAGADLELSRAIANLVSLGITPEDTLAMATTIPSRMIGLDVGLTQAGPADFVHLGPDWRLSQVWRRGEALLR